MSPALMYNFNNYIRIMENHDLYNEKIINIDSCSFLTPTIVLPLVSFIYNYDKAIKDHKNPTVNEYLHKVGGVKKHKTTTFPFRWLDETTENSYKKHNFQIIKITNFSSYCLFVCRQESAKMHAVKFNITL